MANIIATIKAETHGFITGKERLQEIIEYNRLFPLLVRCGGGRFTCPAQDVEHFIEIITREDSDYVRDVSIPAGY